MYSLISSPKLAMELVLSYRLCPVSLYYFLHISVMCFDELLKMQLVLSIVGLIDGRLVFPVHHLGFVEEVGIINLLEIKM
jgi:hypothetical protein